jgi:hypothetical protein
MSGGTGLTDFQDMVDFTFLDLSLLSRLSLFDRPLLIGGFVSARQFEQTTRLRKEWA